MNVVGIIFANIYDSSLGELTNKRTMASLPYGGRYRQIDFVMSNMANSGIRRIGILSRYNYQSLMNHVGSGEEWGLELGEGGLEFLTPYSMSASASYRGKMEALHSAMSFLNSGPEDEYVVLADSSVLCNLDMNTILAAHVASGKDLTVVVKAGIANGNRQLDMALKLDASGEIADLAVDYAAPEDYLASMATFIISKRLLRHYVLEGVAHNLYRFERDFVLHQYQAGNLSINVYDFPGIALFNESAAEYYQNNMALIDTDIRHNLFQGCHPIFTKVRDRVPTYYGEDCQIDDCIVADGCMLEGAVSRSVLFRQVHIGAGSQVEGCLIMNDTVVGENCCLKYVILDKDVVVRSGATLIGTPKNPIIVKKGEIV